MVVFDSECVSRNWFFASLKKWILFNFGTYILSKIFNHTLHLKQSLCHLASKATMALSEIGFSQPLHLAAKMFSKSSLQYGFPSLSKNDSPDIGFMHGPPHTKWSSCHVWPSALMIFWWMKVKIRICFCYELILTTKA